MTYASRTAILLRSAVASAAMALPLLGSAPARAQFGNPLGQGGMLGPGAKPPEYRDIQFTPQGPQIEVADVQIRGNRVTPRSEIEGLLRTRRGRIFDPEVLQADVHSLLDRGRFADVRTYTQRTPAGMVVIFELLEPPKIEYVRFVGNHGSRWNIFAKGLSDYALNKEVGLKKGESLNVYAVEEARRRLENLYQEKGYAKAEVVVLEGDKSQDRGVVFLISEGNVERIFSTKFEGNTIATDARLKTVVKSKPGILYYFGGKFDKRKIDEDVDLLTAYYRNLGFFRARVGRHYECNEAGKWLDVTFVIDEGPRYKIREVSFAGNDKYDSNDVMALMELKPGDYFNQDMLLRDEFTVKDLYGSRGHIFADIKAETVFFEEPGWVDLVYNIKEGDVYRVGQINVHIGGDHPHTKRNVVLNRLSLRPGDIIDIRELRNSERRLKASQLFENDPAAGVTPKIVVRPPDLNDAAIAANSAGAAYRGQSPDGVQWMTVDLHLPARHGTGASSIWDYLGFGR
jgi:outer membrane protein insertion porin family